MPACLLTADLQDKKQPICSAIMNFWLCLRELFVMCSKPTCFAKYDCQVILLFISLLLVCCRYRCKMPWKLQWKVMTRASWSSTSKQMRHRHVFLFTKSLTLDNCSSTHWTHVIWSQVCTILSKSLYEALFWQPAHQQWLWMSNCHQAYGQSS